MNTQDYILRKHKFGNRWCFDIEQENLIYSDCSPTHHGMQCNFVGGTKEHDEIMSLCDQITALIKKVDEINSKGQPEVKQTGNKTNREVLNDVIMECEVQCGTPFYENILKAMTIFSDQEASRREMIARNEANIIKTLTHKIDQRIDELNDADADFCKDRWDMTKPQMERALYREMSNQVTATRQELQRLKKIIYLPDTKLPKKEINESVRAVAAATFKAHMSTFESMPIAWHIYKRAFDLANYHLKNNNTTDKTSEFIICSAVRWQKTIICGRRHADCYTIADALMNGGFLERERKHQGFMTSTGRFIDRAEAFKIAKANNQIIHKMFDNDKEGSLTSEDLYGVEEEI